MELIGRSSSHYTRVAQIFAHELEVPFSLVPVFDLTSTQADCYGDNPALKIPMLRESAAAEPLFGAQNICRRLVELRRARPGEAPQVVWPETLTSHRSRNANELVWHGMAAQVQLVFGIAMGKLDAENVYFAKARRGFIGALEWLDQQLPAVLAEHPPDRTLSLFEVALFCLIDHVETRGTVPLSGVPRLVEFSGRFGERESARRTPYRFDVPPANT